MARIDHIEDLRVFDAVARTGQLTRAARDLGLATSVASKRLARLEATLGRRLADRSGAQLRLTHEGRGFLPHCRGILGRVDGAEESLGVTETGPVRVTATHAFALRQLAPLLPGYLAGHDGVRIEMVSDDRRLDLVSEGIDLAFRQMPGAMAAMPDAILPDAQILVASPAYLARAGQPVGPDDLINHALLIVGVPGPRQWHLRRVGGRENSRVDVPLQPQVAGTEGELAHALALAGAGIAMKSVWDVADDLAADRLRMVLPGWTTGPRCIEALMPMRDFQPRRVRRYLQQTRGALEKAVSLWPDALRAVL